MIILSEIINWANIISFTLGVLAGVLIIVSIFLIAISSSKKEKKKISGPTIEHIDEDKIKQMILNKQNDFIHEVEENDKDYIKTAFQLSTELLHEVASYYFPDSKRPEYELSIGEATQLITYIMNRIEKLFDKPIVRHFKKSSLAQIADLINKGRKATNNETVKAISGAGSEAINASKTIINTLNPVYWFKKIVVKGTINVAMKQACKKGIAIVGVHADADVQFHVRPLHQVRPPVHDPRERRSAVCETPVDLRDHKVDPGVFHPFADIGVRLRVSLHPFRRRGTFRHSS